MGVSSREIMLALGIKNIKTLTRWHQAGVIPEPTIERHPGGHGTMAHWDGWVLDHCRAIKQLTDSGQTINEVAATYGNDWVAIEARYHRYSFARASENTDREKLLMNISEAIYDSVAKHFTHIRRRLEMTTVQPVARDIVIQSLLLIEDGYNPVLILSPEGTVVVPDFALSLHLAHDYQNGEPFLVLPLFPILKQHKVNRKRVKEPQIFPVHKVRLGINGEEKEVVMREPGWKFQIQGELE